MNVEQSPGHRPPSGDQFAIGYADAKVQISQVGATLRDFTVGGRNVIDGFAIDERATDGRGQVLAPWPNRLTDGRYRYGDRDCQAPINEVGRHTAIHGLVRWLDWSLVTHDPASVTLSCAVRPQPGYEWQLDLQITYALSQDGLAVTCRAFNADREPAPFGVGFHPYLTLGTASVDGLTRPCRPPPTSSRTVRRTARSWPRSRGRRRTSSAPAGSGRHDSTTLSAAWSAATTVVPLPNCTTRTAAGPSTFGSMTPTGT